MSVSVSFKRSGLVLVCALLILFSGCNTSAVRDYTDTGSTQKLTDEESRRWYAGKALDKSIKNKGMLYGDAKLDAYLQSVMDRIYPEFRGSIRVKAIDAVDLNAFALPNGSVYINIGLLARMRNEAQLAMVLGHEGAHFVEQHSLKQRNMIDAASMAAFSITLLTGVPFSGDMFALGVMSGYSQDFERAADRKGFDRVHAAGYDVAQASEVFVIMKEEVEALDIQKPYFYSSHPRLKERIDTLNQFAKDKVGTAGDLKTDTFLQQISPLREVILQRYIALRDIKRPILILEDAKRRSYYPKHAKYYLGEAYRLRAEAGDEAKALQAYRDTLDEAPYFSDSYKALGLMHMKQGQKQQALDYFHQYLAMAKGAQDRAYIESYIDRLKD